MRFFSNNKNTIRLLFIFFLFFVKTGVELYGQNIQGKVIDKGIGEELIFASISVFENEELVIKGETDFDGNYNIKLSKGIYDLEVSYIGYPSKKIKGIILSENQTMEIDFQLEDNQLSEPGLFEYKIPVLKKEKIEVVRIDNLETINRKPKLYLIEVPNYLSDRSAKIIIKYENTIGQLPTRNILEIASYFSGVSFCR